MSDKDTGGPAFPTNDLLANGKVHPPSQGMTLREWYAGMALQGILAGDHPITHGLDAETVVAEAAHSFADAMLKERSK